MIGKFATVELQTVLLILCHQVNHRLTAIAGFPVYMFKQQQRCGATTVKQFAISGLYIQQVLRG